MKTWIMPLFYGLTLWRDGCPCGGLSEVSNGGWGGAGMKIVCVLHDEERILA
jgi:hypothetical protein